MMELSEKLKVLVDVFCEVNKDVIPNTEVNKTLLRMLVHDGAIMAYDHYLFDIVRECKKEKMEQV